MFFGRAQQQKALNMQYLKDIMCFVHDKTLPNEVVESYFKTNRFCFTQMHEVRVISHFNIQMALFY